MNFKSLVDPRHQCSMFLLAWNSPPGAIVEVGVYRGGTASMLYSLALQQGRPIYLYDTFEGMPFASGLDTHAKGEFADTSYPHVAAALPVAHVVKGVFPATFIPCGPIAFVHADADQYQSTKDIANRLGPLMAKGGIMLFDDWSLDGCQTALLETLGQPSEFIDDRPVFRFVEG